eukprot:gene20909-27101_t
MVGLAIRLSPQDPNYEVNVTTPTIENQIILAPTPSPRGNRNVRDLFDQENIFLSENKRQESPARKYISPMKSRSNSLASSINKSSIGSTNKPLNYREILPLLSSKKTKSNDSKTNVDFTNTVEANNSEEAIAENSTFTSMVEEDVEQKDLSNETNQNEIEIDDEITESIEEIQINRTIDDSNYDFIDNSNYYEEKESCHNRYNEFDYDDEDIQATWKNSNEEIYMHSPIPAKTFIPFQCLNNTNTKEIETDDLNEDILDEDDFHTPRTSPIRNPFIESNNEIVTDTTINKQLDDRIGDLLDESINEESQDIENEDNNIDKVDEKIINNDNLEYNNITTNLSNKTPVKSKRGSIATPNRFKTPTKITKAIANTPIYPNGMTAGENAKYYDNNMRNYSNNNRKQSSTRKQSILSPHSNKLPITLDELSPVFQKSTISKEGRPSTGTIEKQWEFMKAYFVNNIDDELECDIALANFLTGDKKQYFENYESLDINEMRAIAVCLPDKFELDNDGKKAEWRARFMTRVKQLVGQFNGDLVKGGWDRKHNRRSMVKLPPLKPEQLRRPIYYYRTKEQCDSRLKQYDDKQALLDKKTVWLSNARITVDEAKREYDVILNEMRDPELKAAYGVEQFAMAKDLAKQEFIEADKKRKNLEKEVIQLKATIASSPMSREQFYASMVELDKFLAERDIDWNQSNLPPVLRLNELKDAMPNFCLLKKKQR